MAILRDATSSHNGFGAAATTYTQAHTCTGADRMLVVGLIHNTDEDATATYNGVSMTAQTRIFNTNTCVQTFTLANPASGNNNIVFSWATSDSFYSVGMSYTGCKQTEQPDSSAQGQSDVSNLTVSTTVVLPDCWLVGVYADDVSGAATEGTGTSISVSLNDIHRSVNGVDSNASVAAGSRSLQVLQAGTDNKAMAIVSIAPSSSGFMVMFD